MQIMNWHKQASMAQAPEPEEMIKEKIKSSYQVFKHREGGGVRDMTPENRF